MTKQDLNEHANRNTIVRYSDIVWYIY